MVDNCLLEYNCRTHAGAEHSNKSGYITFKYRVLILATFQAHGHADDRTVTLGNVSPSIIMLRCLLISSLPALTGSLTSSSLRMSGPRLSLLAPLSLCLHSPISSPARTDPRQHQAGDLSPGAGSPGSVTLACFNITTQHQIMTVNHSARTIEDFI